jgi:beta-lactamase regulating signal transducer with metallopeptidase domain
MKTDLALGVLQANLAAAAAIVLILVLRLAIRHRFGAGAAYQLWLLAPLAAVATALPSRQASVAAPNWFAFSLPDPTGGAGGPAALAPTDPAALSPDLVIGWLQASAPLVWIAGAAAMLAWLANRQIRFLRDAGAGGAGPAVVGVLRPRIVTPADFTERYSAREQAMILAHEQVHLIRQVARMNAAVALIRCLFWFNPLIHVAARQMRIDQEMACDAQVLARHPKARRPYAEALLKTQLAARPLPFGCYWPAGTLHPLTERIAMLKFATLSPRRRLAGGALIAGLTTAVGLAAWAAQPAQSPDADMSWPSNDGAGSVLLTGQVRSLETRDTGLSFSLVDEATNTVWRVHGAGRGVTPPGLWNELAEGASVLVKAAEPRDRTCAPNCQVLGQEITFNATGAVYRLTPEGMTQAAALELTNSVLGGSAQMSEAEIARAKVGRVDYVGAAQIPLDAPFARYFNGADPRLIRGRVAEVRFEEGGRGELIVTGEDGVTYRINGGATDSLAPDVREMYGDLVGESVVVRGYGAFDTSCEGGCLVDGRDVSFADGAPALGRPAG